MSQRFIIGKGELLTYPIPPPAIKPTKAHPYSFEEALERLVPQVETTVAEFDAMPKAAFPGDVAVAKFTLHPAYIAKSFFPAAFLQEAGLTPIGSRTVKVRPVKNTRKSAPKECETTELFVAGRRASFRALRSLVENLDETSGPGRQFAEFESIAAMDVEDRIRRPLPDDEDVIAVFEIGLHVVPGLSSEELRSVFAAYAKRKDFTVNESLSFPVGRMLFLAVEGPTSQLEELAQFSLLRVVRLMPKIRALRPVGAPRTGAPGIDFTLPRSQPISSEPKVAVLDGGLPNKTLLQPFIQNYYQSDPDASDVPGYVEHGQSVTSALLFGPVDPDAPARRPYSYVDHHRILDALSDEEDPYELYRTLAHVEEVLLSRRYQFINLSLGPDLPIEDTDVHAWTAVIDNLLTDGETLLTVAVGNNGKRDKRLGLNRIQVPSDSVNALSVGATNRMLNDWEVADYSARGPGRSPGRRKPDVVAFGGSSKEYFHVMTSGNKPMVIPQMGTSFAAPFALRTAVGIRAVLGTEVQPLTIKALLVHCTENSEEASHDDAGWGRVQSDLEELIVCGPGVARVIYQGWLLPGKYLKAPVPLPNKAIVGSVNLTATFCYASPVDVEDAAAYTKAGLTVTFRPRSDQTTESGLAKSKPFFPGNEFRNESELRTDLGKWETVLHASKNMRGASLSNAAFDVHYNARDGGAAAAKAEPIPYALVVTLRAKKHASLYDDILAANVVLKELEPQIAIPVGGW